jgi:hypothetical protein
MGEGMKVGMGMSGLESYPRGLQARGEPLVGAPAQSAQGGRVSGHSPRRGGVCPLQGQRGVSRSWGEGRFITCACTRAYKDSVPREAYRAEGKPKAQPRPLCRRSRGSTPRRGSS